jgi:serralysin
MFGTPTLTDLATFTSDNNIDGLLAGEFWQGGSVTFSFPDSTDDYEITYESSNRESLAGFQTFTELQRVATRAWMAQFASVSNLDIIELTGASDRDATIRLANSSKPGTAYAYNPGEYVEGGDAFFGTTANFNNPLLGNYDYFVFAHEIGHSLGLKHGHEDDATTVPMNPDRDSSEFSIMTYRSYIDAPVDAAYNASGSFAQSLMMYDIRAIQQLYGADFGNNASNTTYTFSTTTGEMFVNGVGQGASTTNTIFRTVWDGNGIDTYDFANYTTKLSIDLTPGGWSDLDVGGNFQRARLRVDYSNASNNFYARAQLFNAVQYNGDVRSLIENANGGAADDIIVGNIANNILTGNAGNDNIDGGAGNDTLFGGDGNDTIEGGSGNDTLSGGVGDDNLNTGGGGIDTLNGGIGNDTYSIYNSANIIVENAGEGTDTVWTNVNYTLSANIERMFLVGSINGTGSSGNDNIIGYAVGNNIIDGGAGNDNLDGGAGNDTLFGGDGNDTLEGGAGNDTISGGAGDDILNTSGGGVDSLSGGTGNDTYSIYNSATTIVENAGEGTDTVWTNVNYTLSANIERMFLVGSINGTGSSGNDNIIGYAVGDNIIDGGAGNDNLDGGAGNDTLFGGDGNDTLEGGTGNDTISGGAGDDILNTVGGGIDSLSGGTGNDTYSIYNSATTIVENAGEGIENVWSTVNYTLAANVENLYLVGAVNGTGNSGDNTLVGYGAGNNTLDGGAGNDTLDGGLGADTTIGGTGNDTYIVDNSGDVVTETSTNAAEIDTVQASIDYTLVLNVENLVLTGSAIRGTGNSLNNAITGNSAANIIYGGGGQDLLAGGLGADIFQFLNQNEGIDTITDFAAGSDKISLSAAGFGGGLSVGTLSSSQFVAVTSGSSATSASQRLIYNSTTGGLFFDADGSGLGSAVQFATLSSRPSGFGVSDFSLVA